MVNFDNLNSSKIEYFNKLILIRTYLAIYNNKRIFDKIVKLYYIIEQEEAKFEYVYKNINHISSNHLVIEKITCLNFDLITLSSKKSKLLHDVLLFDKFIYIISIAVNFDTNIKTIDTIINKYLSKIIKYGNVYDIINSCLLTFKIKLRYNDITINYNYYEGLIKCLQLSPRWNESILYFHNKHLLNKYNLKDIFIEVSKYLLTIDNNYSNDIMMYILGNKNDFIILNS